MLAVAVYSAAATRIRCRWNDNRMPDLQLRLIGLRTRSVELLPGYNALRHSGVIDLAECEPHGSIHPVRSTYWSSSTLTPSRTDPVRLFIDI
jgi:hypothetical protein